MKRGGPLFLLFVMGQAGCLGATPGASARLLSAMPAPGDAGAQALWTIDPTTQIETSRWQLVLGGEPVTLVLTHDHKKYSGTVTSSEGRVDAVDWASFDAASGVLKARRVGPGFWQWIFARSVEGVLAGRASYNESSNAAPIDVVELTQHVTGWNERYFSADIVPFVFEVTVNGKHARLRLDRDPSGAIAGRFKVNADDDFGDWAEEPEADLTVQTWNGTLLSFSRPTADGSESYDLTFDGHLLRGTMLASDGSRYEVGGARVAITSMGFLPRSPSDRDAWQARTRRQLAHLMIGDNPAPLSMSVERHAGSVPSDDREAAGTRDDDDALYPRNYSVDEVQLSFTIASPWGGDPMSRSAHGYLTTPLGAAPAGGWPALVVLNGHQGSAAALLDASDPIYWYGDAWARRGFVVLALDVSHRPVEDRGGLYGDYESGDDPARGNGAHPSIKIGGLDSDWVENGERVWDVERAVDWLASLGNINMQRIGVTGLSMGGEVATLAGAIDPRIRSVIASGAPPSLAMMPWHGNHGCYLWATGDVRDYYESADVAGLVAPRALIFEIGHDDSTFSDNTPSFVSAKEEMRTTMSAFADAPAQLVVYLHPGGHEYRFGDVYVESGANGLGVLSPTVMAPRQAGDSGWSADDATMPVVPSVADALQQLLPQQHN